MEHDLDEKLVAAWVRLTSVLKNTRMTDGLAYNEAVVMLAAYDRWREDRAGMVSFKELMERTRMLKSLVNRTIGSLVGKGLLERCDGADRRTTFVRIVPENLDVFLRVHERSLATARELAAFIGEEDARAFIRIAEKIGSYERKREE